MNEAIAIQRMIEQCEGFFPKTCPNCRRIFPTLKDYLQNTERLGKAISFDLELGDLKPANPLGAVAMAICRCGTTLALSSENMPLLRLWSLMLWGKLEAHRRGITPEELLEQLCDKMCSHMLANPTTEAEEPHPLPEFRNGKDQLMVSGVACRPSK
jgi:hypothetical protein